LVATDTSFLKKLKLDIAIQPVDSIGLTGELIELYKVEINFSKIRYDSDDRTGNANTLFERLFSEKEYCAFAPSLPDAIDLAKRFIVSFENEFERMTH